MKDWIHDFHIAQQTLETADTPDAVIDALQDILSWLFDGQILVETYPTLEEAEIAVLPLELQEAALTLTPQSSADATLLVVPLVAFDEWHGLITIRADEPLDPNLAALSLSLTHIASGAISRLRWPTSPQIFRQLVENANVAMNVAGLDGIVTYANLAAAQLYGLEKPEDLVGKRAGSLYYPGEEARVRQDILTKSRTADGWTGDVLHQYADGVPLPVRLAIFAMRDHQGRMTSYGGIAQNLSEQHRLLTSLQQQVRQLAALNTISQVLVAAYNLDDLWDEINNQMSGLFNMSTFFVMRYDPPTNLMHYVYLAVDGRRHEPEPPYPLSGLSGQVVRTGMPLLLHDLPAQEAILKKQGIKPLPIWGRIGARSWLGVPLRARDGTIMGLISVQSEQANVFNAGDVQLLSTIATQISLAMENARLFGQLSEAAQQLKERARRLESMYKIGTLLSTTLDRNRILTLAAEQIVRLLKVDHCGVAIFDEKTGVTSMAAEHPRSTMSEGQIAVVGTTILDASRAGDVLVSNDVEGDDRLAGVLPMLRRHSVRSLIIMRLVAKGKQIGAIGIESMSQIRPFSYEEAEMCRALATQIALAVENSNLYAQALAANKLKSQFLATMSHELRTPLNAVMGYTEMVLKGVYGAMTDKARDRMQRVYTNAQHLLALINDVLDLAKIESGRMTLSLETLELIPLIAQAIANIAPQAEAKRLLMQSEMPDGLPPVLGDALRIQQVLTNLMSNAVKFTHEGGVTVSAFTIHVKHGECPDYSLDQVGIGLHDGDWLCISVKDTGIGIAPENFGVIFDAFRQVDASIVREYEGTGLGLAISRQLVELHGGKIWLESELGRGSTFTLALPVKRESLGDLL